MIESLKKAIAKWLGVDVQVAVLTTELEETKSLVTACCSMLRRHDETITVLDYYSPRIYLGALGSGRRSSQADLDDTGEEMDDILIAQGKEPRFGQRAKEIPASNAVQGDPASPGVASTERITTTTPEQEPTGETV